MTPSRLNLEPPKSQNVSRFYGTPPLTVLTIYPMLVYSRLLAPASPPSLALLADGVNSYLSMYFGLANLIDLLGPLTVPPV